MTAISKEFMAGGRRAPMVPCKLTRDQEQKFQISQAYLLVNQPFFADLYYSKLKLVFTKEVPIAATDSFSIFINPDTFFKYDVKEQVFIIAHEIMHCIYNDCGLAWTWQKAGRVTCPGGVLPYDDGIMGYSMDYPINALLIHSGVGKFNKDWLYDADMSEKGEESCVVVYEKRYKQRQSGGKGKGPGDGRFDEHLRPGAGAGDDPDKAQGRRSEAEWRVAVAAAAHAAEAQGKLPAGLKRFVGDILEPRQSWQDQVRSAVARRLGNEGYDWTSLDERMLLRPAIGYDMVCFPQQSSFDCGTIAIGYDCSGSCANAGIAERFLGETAGIIADLNPKELMVFWCDARVHRVDHVDEPQDLTELKLALDEHGIPGGGGTSFVPVFEDIEKRGVVPDLLVYFTDLIGTFPKKAPGYPVVWACINDKVAPFGDTIKVEL